MYWLLSRFSMSATGARRSVIRELLKLTQQPGIISFAGGLPSPETFPVREIAELSREVILKEGAWALQYGPTEGVPGLKEEIIRHIAKDGMKAGPENILITSASQQGLDLVSRVFLNRRNRIIVGRPTYLGALSAFRSTGALFSEVELDEEGMRTDRVREQVEALRLEGNPPKFVYVVPDFQNPSGVTLSLKRRKELLSIAREHRFPIIEDSPYRALRYVGSPVPSLYELDGGEGFVISLHTFSKILFPGLRLGWILAGPAMIDRFVMAKQAMDLCSPGLTQAIALEYCRRGLLDGHIQDNIVLYREKRKVMLEALERFMPDHPEIRWTRPEGGLFLWLCLPESVDVEIMFHDAIAAKVAYVVGTCFYAYDGGHHAMRLNFSYPSESDIVEGIRRLADVIRNYL
ncbi:MAG TPA: PLP-dependent aminotransferase family protein [bacterium]|nr:PLP-dependent aminotransferase family protein [bacterium]